MRFLLILTLLGFAACAKGGDPTWTTAAVPSATPVPLPNGAVPTSVITVASYCGDTLMINSESAAVYKVDLTGVNPTILLPNGEYSELVNEAPCNYIVNNGSAYMPGSLW